MKQASYAQEKSDCAQNPNRPLEQVDGILYAVTDQGVMARTFASSAYLPHVAPCKEQESPENALWERGKT
jgi:hypothetical protein